jgi:hypothetical protein
MANTRVGHFAAGATTNTGTSPTEPASLQARAQAFNSKTPGKFSPNGVNQQLLPSGNGMSQKDASRITPSGMLPSQNGSSQSTYGKLTPQYGMSLNI